MQTMMSRPTRAAAAATAAAMLLSACKTMPTGSSGGESGSYVQSCVTGAVLGAAVGAAYEAYQGKKSGKSASQSVKDNSSTLAKAAAAGCAIGLAATAVGRMLDANQQARHEEAMQRDAKRRSLEQQNYAAIERRSQTTTGTPQQRAARDAELEKARADWQTNYTKPVTYDLGGGATTTVQPEPPKQAPQPGGSGCVDYSVSVRSGAGNARQYETWCPDANGRMARVEVRDAPSA